MKPNVDYDLLVKAERIRYQSDFSSAHWLCQVISNYEQGLSPKIAEAYETVLRIAINVGVKAAIEKTKTYPEFLGFPSYTTLTSDQWEPIAEWIQNNWETHLRNRFGYLKEGD